MGLGGEEGGGVFFISSVKARSTLLLLLLALQCCAVFLFGCAGAYDPLETDGNITIRWDVQQWRDEVKGYTAMVSIFNYQRFRHIEKPGWKLSWRWKRPDEVIWGMLGAEATEQGNCSSYKDNLPHSCERRPVIVDLLPGTVYNLRTPNCCRGGVLSSLAQDASKSVASFQITVGNGVDGEGDGTKVSVPVDFSLDVPGYTCGLAVNVTATKFPVDGGRRKTQARQTLKITCSYSPTTNPVPTCCVSLSSFYDETIIPCPRCSCACQDDSRKPNRCARDGERPPVLQMPHDDLDAIPPVVRCTQHMCPIRVHWHVKVSYRDYWRVKMTVTNLNLVKNYSDWNLVVQHPNLVSLAQVFSFNYQPLNRFPGHNDSGVFWGIPYYNDMLLQSGADGNVQSEMLMHKDDGEFTFKYGWAFPRKIYFNGEPCVMPSPDMYPKLPAGFSGGATVKRASTGFALLPLLIVFFSFCCSR